jgi:3-oxoadipate enol-lactonase
VQHHQPHPEGRPIWDERIAQVLAGGLGGMGGTGGMESQLEATLRRWFTDDFRRTDPETVAWITDLILATPPQGFIGCCRAIQGFDVTARLGAIDTPVLLLPGEKDPGTLPAYSEVIRERVPGARLTLVPGAAHLSNVERAEFVTAAMLEFLAGVEVARGA